MPWQDDPVVQQPAQQATGSWMDDPVVQQTTPPAPAASVPAEAAGVPAAPQKRVGNLGDALLEGSLTFGSGLVSLPASGLATLGALGTNALGATDIDIRGLTERVQRALTYEPRTRSGEVAANVIAYPFEKLAQFGNFAGKKTTEGVVNAGGNIPAAATAGTAVGTAIQLAPALVLRSLGKKTPQEQAAAAAEAETRARDYVSTRTPLDYDSVAARTREALETVASDSKSLGKLDAAALERQARFESLPVPIETTSARITRDPVALRNEANAAATNAGKPIRDVFVDNNAKLIENLQVLQGKASRGRGSRGDVETGRSVQDAARAKLEAKEAQVDALYKKARADGELQGKVSPRPVFEVLRRAADKSDLKWVETWLNDNKVVQQTPQGTVINKLSLETLEGLRRDANARVKNGGSDGYAAGKIVRAVDQATYGAGGKSYKAARKARFDQAQEFQEQRAVSRLVDDKSRTDRTVALEDTWNDVVLRGSLDDLVKVKRSLLTGGDAATKAAGKSAWRDIRAETMAYIEQQATKGVQLLEDGRPNVSPAALKRAVDKIGTEKLDQIFGSGTRKKIDEIVTAARDLKTEPTAVHGGSSTLGNVLAFLEQSISRIPGSSLVSGTVRAIGKVNELGKGGRQVVESRRDPLREAAGQVKSRNKLREFVGPAGAVQDGSQ